MGILPKTRTTLLLNWATNPYHAPILVAQELGFFEREGLKMAILEPRDPSDVTELVANRTVDYGLKAMIHTVAARAKGFSVKSIATILDEPPTGLIFLKSSGITDFASLEGKKIGFVGEFGKIMVDNLAKHAGLTHYETVRVGMNVVDAILEGRIDTGIGFSNYQLAELETHGPVGMFRIDELAGLGCCCFCSIQLITHEKTLDENPERTKKLLRAVQAGARVVAESPEKGWEVVQRAVPRLRTELGHVQYLRSLPFVTRSLRHTQRDWDKVGKYAGHLGILPEGYDVHAGYTDEFVPTTPAVDVQPIVQSV